MPETGTCSSCGASIGFVQSAKTGNFMPIDAKPCADGNIVILDGKAHVLAGDLFDEQLASKPKYKSHFATCPTHEQHRKVKEKS